MTSRALGERIVQLFRGRRPIGRRAIAGLFFLFVGGLYQGALAQSGPEVEDKRFRIIGELELTGSTLPLAGQDFLADPAIVPEIDAARVDLRPAWQRHAAPSYNAPGQPVIAIVIDDLGMNPTTVARAVDLEGPLTLSFLPYAKGIARSVVAARDAGHEVLAHIPMEPLNPAQRPGPNTLKLSQSPRELRWRLSWALDRVPGSVGISNHMGSKFTADTSAMSLVLAEVKQRGMLYLDSLTIETSRGAPLADQMGMPFLQRDIFIDHRAADKGSVLTQLEKLKGLALKRGYAVGIGHPHESTFAALEEWLPHLDQTQIALVPVSVIAAREAPTVRSLPASGAMVE